MPKILRMMCAVAMCSGCFTPDRDALHAQMVERCAVALPGPQIVCADGVAADGAWRRSFDRAVVDKVTQAQTEVCLLAVDCDPASDDDADLDDGIVALSDCLADDGSVPLRVECGPPCSAALSACDAGCSDAGVDVCFDAYDACLSTCTLFGPPS